MNIVQQIIDFIMGLLGQSTSDKPKSIEASPKPAAPKAPEPETEETEEEVDDEDVDDEDEDDDDDGEHIIETRDGAVLVEDPDDGERMWANRVDLEVARDSWDDVWGPLDGPDDESLARFFMHETTFQMEAQSDPMEGEAKLQAFGYDDVGHYFKVRATILKHFGTADGPNIEDCVMDSQQVMSAMMKGQQMMHRANMQQTAEADPALVAPIEGITIEKYAAMSANAAGKSQEEWAAVLASEGLDLAKWEAVSEGWNNRMQNDDTHTLVTLYGQGFQSAGAGQFGSQAQAHAATGYDGSAAGGEAPMSLERCCEIQGAMQAWSTTGQDVNAMIAKTFDMNAADFAAAHSWWLSQLAADVARFGEYNTLVEKYQAQYAAGAPDAPDDDLEF
jgi:hypothetical protein